jgi:RNA polymerase sigma factor (sigma-70 family)
MASDDWPAGRADFTTTRWSVVMRVRDGHSPQAAEALEQLCRGYWFPVYAYVRRHFNDPEASKDLTQEFFAHLIGKNLAARADPERGRFRAFVLTLLRHFLINEWERERAQKRGGGQTPVSLDALEADERYRLEPVQEQAPDQVFDRKWAEEILGRVHVQLRHDYEAAGLGPRFDKLKTYLLHGHNPSSYADAATQLGLSEAATKSAIFTLRRRFAEIFRREISQTVASAEDADAEIRHLLTALV